MKQQQNKNWTALPVRTGDGLLIIAGVINLALAFVPPGELNAAAGGWCCGLGAMAILDRWLARNGYEV